MTIDEHTSAQELAARALNVPLEAEDQDVLDAHLAVCPDCRAAAAEQMQVSRATSGRPRRRISWAIPERFRWPAVAMAAAVAVVIAVVAGTLPWGTRDSDRPGVAVVSPSSGDPATSLEPGGSADPPRGERPPILAYAPLAELTPIDASGSVLGLDSQFRLASLDGTPPIELASRLTVEPSIDLAVEPETDGAAVRLRPKEPLTPGAVYRFTLVGANGNTLDTWAFQARQPVRVVATIPGDTQTDVPLNTGIEVTFDQDGVVDAETHVTIEPPTKGRFEQHGRVLVFVPARLKPATIYTVTVSSGVGVKGTDETLAEDVRFRFETAAKAGSQRAVVLQFPDDVVEVATAARPELTMWAYSEDGRASPKTARIEVYRLAGLSSAIDAFRQLRRSSRWARWSSSDLVPTKGLRRVMAFDARLQQVSESLWFRFPKALPSGSYLVQHPSTTRPIQTILQVTDVAGYLTVSDMRTLVWANDLAGRGPLVGATVTAQAAVLGQTDAEGLLLADTPAALKPEADGRCTDACDPVVIVTARDGRSAFLPASGSRDGDGGVYNGWSLRDEGYWLVYHTDRTLYRRTDTVNVWGVIRDRDSGVVPETIDIHLIASSDGPASPPIATLQLRPGPTGAFTASVPLRNLPEGSYRLALRVGSTVAGTTDIQVDRILKPAYRIEVETGHRVYIEGDRIKITALTTFFEGSPVPGVPLRIGGIVERGLTTDRVGTAIHRTVARVEAYDRESGNASYQIVSVNPARAEEGEIAGASREFVVFPSSQTINAEASIRTGRVRITGGVHLVDRDRLEAELAAGRSLWELDPRGKPVAGATLTATFVELIPVRRQVRTEYDFIEKKVVPVYEYSNRTRAAGTIKVRTAPDGAFSVSVPDSGKDHDYAITLSVGDPDGHAARLVTYASGGPSNLECCEEAVLTPTDPSADHPDGYGVGDRIDLTMRDPRRGRAGGRYLFQLAQRGLREAIVQSSPRLVERFESWAVPNVQITAVRFTGTAYIEAGGYEAWFRSDDRAVDVALSATRPRYAPGDEVTLEVRTRDTAGKPVASTVILQAVDEKLFQIGAAADADPLRELYASLSNGIRVRYASHLAHARRDGEGGDTTGGGGDDRKDFRDSLLFQAIDTGPDGRASTTFRVSDDLTSWRVSAAAVTADLGAGHTSIQVPVGLPFFVDASIAPEYLVGDRPSIQVRAYGSALAPGSDVRISVESPSLGLAPIAVTAKAFENITVALPRLTIGAHRLTITARTGSGASVMNDRLTRSFAVIESRLQRTMTAHVDLPIAGPLPGGDGLTTVLISDAGTGRYLPGLLDVAGGDGARLERALAAAVAASLVNERFGADDSVAPTPDFDGDRYQTPDGGIAPVPYASGDLELSALVAIVVPEWFHAGRLRGYLDAVLASPKETRERRMHALAGLAALGAPVLPEIQAAATDDDLTVRERLMIGLGASAIGDAASARSIARSLLESYGEDLGEQVRLRVGDAASDITAATALMAMLAAATGDPLAPALWAYVEGNPSSEAPPELHAVAFISRMLDRRPVQPASFAYKLDGKRTIVKLDGGETHQLTLTADQRAGLTLERIDGEIAVAMRWREPVAAATFERDLDIEIRRTRSPSGTVKTGDLVRIDLTVTFGPKAPAGCHQVTELVPSGLVALGGLAAWPVDYGEGASPTAAVSMPYAQTGQRVMFCAEPTARSRTIRLRYYARVITPGTYAWEPAIVESRTGADRVAVTPEGKVTIR